MSTPKKLRLITYLSPGIPIEVFELLLHYLEDVTGLEGYLMTESRWSGPPPDRRDPFTEEDADIEHDAWFTCYYQAYNFVQAAAPVHPHIKGGSEPVYFSDVVVNGSKKASYTTFVDLKGQTFAFNDPVSLSGSLIVLGNLKKMGYNSNFFGNMLHSGSHLNSIQMILDGKADVAAIDSNVLQYYLKQNPQNRENLSVLTSFGPMPVYPTIFNSRLSSDFKKQISDALLRMHKIPEWRSRMNECYIQNFAEIDESLYNIETGLMDVVKGLSLSNVYY